MFDKVIKLVTKLFGQIQFNQYQLFDK